MVAFLVLVAACDGIARQEPPARAPSRAAVQFGELSVNGQARTYRVFAPPTITPEVPAPLVLALHDAGGSAEAFRHVTQLDTAAAAGNFIVVYPNSLEGTWNGGFCCGRARVDEEDVDDVGFLMRVLDELETDHAVDPARVYAVGASNGAIMAYRLGCQRPDRIAGVAAVGGTMVMDDCAPGQPVSVLAIHGTEDGHVPYEGGPTSGAPDAAPSQLELATAWAALNDCNDADTETDGLVTTASWGGCAGGTAVQLVTIEGGGHTWFSAEFSKAAGAVDATRAITEFFDLTVQ